ncbi:MAG: hypothetical protein DMF37_10095 [Verrucomicrobia bacterium]|nr:MAG: hypothetical protein DMF37_10095 [Verrucomicrobiota bacterium]
MITSLAVTSKSFRRSGKGGKDQNGSWAGQPFPYWPRVWYGEPDAISNAISYAKFRSRSHDPVIRVFDEDGNVIETYEHTGDFKEW